jgi:prevent-host-death family protein
VTEVGAYEAKNTLGHLLDLAERGEEVTITRHGRPVARLVPATQGPNRAQAHGALERLRARAENGQLGQFDWTEWKSMRDDSRP